MEKKQKPSVDWEHWFRLVKVKAWEACALSLGIEPSSMRDGPYSSWGIGPYANLIRGEPRKERVERELRKRYDVILSSLNAREYFTGLDDYTAFARLNQEILLSEFVSWALAKGYSPLPERMAALVRETAPVAMAAPQQVSSTTVDSVSSRATQTRRNSHRRSRVDEIGLVISEIVSELKTFDTMPVWQALLQRAATANENPKNVTCLRGVRGGGVQWVSKGDTRQRLTYKALSGRLRTMERKAHPEP
jgi:hypothetical protein